MFESLVSDLLNRVLGTYIQNIDSSNLNISTWRGDVQLKDLVIKQTALDELELPVRPVFGYLDCLTLKIPWSKLYTAKWEASLEGLSLIVVPNTSISYDPQKEDQLILEAKLMALQKIEEAKQKSKRKLEKKEKENDGFIEKLVAQVIRNIQIEIKNICIRYEDSVTNPAKPFAVGAMLQSLSLQSTDASWIVGLDTSKQIYKLLNMEGLIAYWTPNPQLISQLQVDTAEISKILRSHLLLTEEYHLLRPVISPLNLIAKLQLNPRPELDEEPFTIPKAILDIVLEDLSVAISRHQFADIMSLLDSIDRMQIASNFRKYRPDVTSIIGNAALWWKYAYHCKLEAIQQHHRNWSWSHIKQHRDRCREYKKLYKQKLGKGSLVKEEKEKLEDHEKILDLFNITLVRKQAEMELEREGLQQAEAQKKKGWLRGWLSWGSNETAEEVTEGGNMAQKFEAAMSDDEKRKLYEAIGYTEDGFPTELPAEYVDIKLKFTLSKLCLTVVDELLDETPVCTVLLRHLATSFSQRSAASSHKVETSIESFSISGLLLHTDQPPQLTKSLFISEDVPLISVLFETNPLDEKCNTRVNVQAQPLEIVYDAATINQVADIFSPPKDVSLQQLQAAALNQLEIVKERSISGLQAAIKNRSILDLHVSIQASRVIFPEMGYYDISKSVIVMTLGSIYLESVPREEQNLDLSEQSEDSERERFLLEHLKSSSYDYFSFHFNDIQVLVADASEDWVSTLESKVQTPMHLLRPLSLSVDIFKCLIMNDPNLPRVKIAANLPQISLFVIDSKLVKAAAVANNCFNQEATFPASTEERSFPKEEKDFNQNVLTEEVALVRLENADINPSGESSVTPQFTDLMFFFTINAMTLNLLKSEANGQPPSSLLQVTAGTMSLHITQKTFDLSADISLSDISVNHLEWGNQHIIKTQNSPNESALFSIKFCQVNPKSPDFISHHQGVLQKIDIEMSGVTARLEETVLLSLLSFANALQNQLAEITPPKAAVKEPKAKFSTASQKGNKEKQPKKSLEALSIKPSSQHKKKIIATLGQIELTIARSSCDIAALYIKGFSADTLMQAEEMEISACLKDFSVVNPNPEELHKDILVLEDSHAWEAKIKIFATSPDEVDYFNVNKIDTSIALQLGRPKIVFLNKFVTDVLAWVDNFQVAKDALSSASLAAAEAAKANLKEAYSLRSKVKMDLVLKAPLIIIPNNSQSYQGLLVDLGKIILKNQFRLGAQRNELGHPSLFDDMSIMIQDVKISRKPDFSSTVESPLLMPLSLNLNVQMNFSSSWLKTVPEVEVHAGLKAVQVQLSEEDICTVMCILRGNLGESSNREPPKFSNVPDIQAAITNMKAKEEVLIEHTHPYMKLTATFSIEDISLELFTSELEGPCRFDEASRSEFAKFGLSGLVLKFDMRSDDTISANLILLNCTLRDLRKDFQEGITRMMEKKETASNAKHPVFDVTFIQGRKKDIFVELKVSEFLLIIHLPFLLRMQQLVSVQPPQDMEEAALTLSVPEDDPSKVVSKEKERVIQEDSLITLSIKLEQPDIILVEDLSSFNTSCIILHAEIESKVKIASAAQRNISSTLSKIQMYTCSFDPDKREATSSQILSRSNISFLSSATANHADNIQINIGALDFRVAPDTIELVMSIISCLSSEEKPTVKQEKAKDWTGYWDSKDLDFNELPNLKIDEAEEAELSVALSPKTAAQPDPKAGIGGESLCIEMDCLLVTLEAGSGSTSIPLLKLQSSCLLTAQGFFSSKLTMSGHFGIEVAYYNPRQAIWEPLLEPVEVSLPSGKPEHRSWNIVFEGYMLMGEEEKKETPRFPHPITPDSSPISEDFDFIEVLPPKNKISFLAKDPLDFTITKTFLEVANVLSESFMEAYKGELSVRQSAKAPFKFVNSTGKSIIIDMKESGLQVNPTGESDLKELVIESGGQTELYSSIHGARQHRRHPSLVTQYQTAMERVVLIKIPFLDALCTVPITKADKRLFSLPLKDKPKEKWGLVASVAITGGCKVITFSSCVKVVNELDKDVDIYYMTERGNEVEFVCSLRPQEGALLPCHAVYTPSAELFFSIKGYSVCISPLVWRRLQNFPNLHQDLHCQPRSRKNIHDRPFMFSANCEVEHIYWDNTSRRTIESIMVQVNLRPLITLHNLLPVPVSLFPPGTVREKEVLMPGCCLQITHAELGSIYLEIEILCYHGFDWTCSKSLEKEPPELSVWSFKKIDEESTITLDLGMHIRKLKGVNVLSLYCPFWMVNKTGLDLTYKTDITGYTILHEKNDNSAVLFSFRSKSFFGKKKSNLRVQESEWSEKFPLDTVGSCGAVMCQAKSRSYQVSVDIQLAASGLTKIVTFSAFYKAINRCPYDLEYCFEGDSLKQWHALPSGECIGLWPPGTCRACTLRVQNTAQVTPLVHFDIAHTTLFKLDNKHGGLFTEVTVSEGGAVLSLDQCMEGVAAALVVNHLKLSSVVLWQQGYESNKIEVGPERMKYFTWGSATHNHMVEFSCLGLAPISILLSEDSKGTIGEGQAGWATWLNGAQRCLIVSQDPILLEGPLLSCELERVTQELEVSINSIGFSLVDDIQRREILYLSLASSGVSWEHQKENNNKFRPFTEAETHALERAYISHLNSSRTDDALGEVVQLAQNFEIDFNQMKVLKPFHRIVRRVFQYGIWIQYQLLSAQRNLHMKINKLQLDNQLSDVMFPVVLARVPAPKSVMAEIVPKPFFEMSVVQSLESSIITQYKYFTILIQEFHVKVELPFIFTILEVLFPSDTMDTLYSPEMYTKDLEAITRSLTSMVSGQIKSSKRDFYNYMHLSPIKMHLSFSLTGLNSGTSIPIGGQVIHVFLQSVGVTLTEVQDVVFRLGFLEKKHCWLTMESLQSMVQSHYTNQIMTQLYVLVLGLDVLGNPFGLVLGVTKGFGDLFYEPIQGAVQGPNEFAQGLFYGMRSFMGKTVGGTAGAFSRITGAIGKGVANLTLDEDYQRRRREAMNKKPADGFEAVARSGKGLVTGVFDGVTGVFLKPIEGAKEQGVEGFFKGVGKGMVGFITRPASGLIDFTSGSLDAVMRVADSTEEIGQVRPARFIAPDGIVRPYTFRHAAGTRMLKGLERGKYASTDTYVIHSLVCDGRSIFLATDKRVFFLSRNEILGQWKVEWLHGYEEFAEPPLLTGGKMKFTLRTARKKVLGVFGTSSNFKEVSLLKQKEHEYIVSCIAEAYHKMA